MQYTSPQILCLAAMLAAAGYFVGRILTGLAHFAKATGHYFHFYAAVAVLVLEIALSLWILYQLFFP